MEKTMRETPNKPFLFLLPLPFQTFYVLKIIFYEISPLFTFCLSCRNIMLEYTWAIIDQRK